MLATFGDRQPAYFGLVASMVIINPASSRALGKLHFSNRGGMGGLRLGDVVTAGFADNFFLFSQMLQKMLHPNSHLIKPE